MQIPIENIYYLLCYAWNKLEESNQVKVDASGITEQVDLFAKVLISAIRVLLKRGIDRNYLKRNEEYAGVKGKLDYSQTLKRDLLRQSKTICTYDDFSSDILLNQIMITTIYRLLRTRSLDDELRMELLTIYRMMAGIRLIEITGAHFPRIRLHRNNKFYGFILDVCRILHENTLPSEEKGNYLFADFTRDERKMNQLFESFVRNFYRIEAKDFPNVKRETIQWQFGLRDRGNARYLPQMITDITLENVNRKIIIDAKYYSRTMSEHYDKEKIYSGNLYQLFSYILNQQTSEKKTKQTTGILLYPTIDKEYNLSYWYHDHEIKIITINLNENWKKIETRLLDIVKEKSFC